MEFIKENFSPGMKILELGCGTEFLLSVLERYGFDVYGIDISRKMVAIASDRISNKIRNADALKQIPFLEECFDGVIFIATVHHMGGMKNFELAFANTLRMLKKGGKILVWDHNSINLY